MSRGKQRVSIKCQSHNGAIKVLLPRDFTGLVGYRTHNGNTLFSPAVKGCTTTFSLTRGVGKCFIGDWQHAEFSPQSTTASITAASSGPSPTVSPTDTAAQHLVAHLHQDLPSVTHEADVSNLNSL
jgi:hypothetical protein